MRMTLIPYFNTVFDKKTLLLEKSLKFIPFIRYRAVPWAKMKIIPFYRENVFAHQTGFGHVAPLGGGEEYVL